MHVYYQRAPAAKGHNDSTFVKLVFMLFSNVFSHLADLLQTFAQIYEHSAEATRFRCMELIQNVCNKSASCKYISNYLLKVNFLHSLAEVHTTIGGSVRSPPSGSSVV